MNEEDWDPEAPSEEDLWRFGGDHAECSSCGAEIYDDAPQCPACGKWLSDQDRMGKGMPTWLVATVVILIVISFLLYYVI